MEEGSGGSSEVLEDRVVVYVGHGEVAEGSVPGVDPLINNLIGGGVEVVQQLARGKTVSTFIILY